MADRRDEEPGTGRSGAAAGGDTRHRDAELLYRTLFEQSPDGIVILDPGTALPIEFNEAAHRQLGYSREEFARLQVADYEALDSPEVIRARIEKLLREGRADFETKHRTRDGSLRDIMVTVKTVELGGRPVFYTLFRDITEVRRLELESEMKARLLDISTDSVFLLDMQGKILYCNDAAGRTRKYTREELIGMDISELDTPEFAVLVRPRLQELLEKGSATFESAHRCKDGTVIPIEIHASIVSIRGERRVLSADRDISERKLNEDAMRRYTVVLEEANHRLEKALSEVKTLKGMLPICAACKKVRDDSGYWTQIESYVTQHSNAEFTHGLCPDCVTRLYPQYRRDGEGRPG